MSSRFFFTQNWIRRPTILIHATLSKVILWFWSHGLTQLKYSPYLSCFFRKDLAPTECSNTNRIFRPPIHLIPKSSVSFSAKSLGRLPKWVRERASPTNKIFLILLFISMSGWSTMIGFGVFTEASCGMWSVFPTLTISAKVLLSRVPAGEKVLQFVIGVDLDVFELCIRFAALGGGAFCEYVSRLTDYSLPLYMMSLIPFSNSYLFSTPLNLTMWENWPFFPFFHG